MMINSLVPGLSALLVFSAENQKLEQLTEYDS
jgi:hypothetical protein